MFAAKYTLILILTLNCLLEAHQADANNYNFLEYEAEKKKSESIENILFPEKMNMLMDKLSNKDAKDINVSAPLTISPICQDNIVAQKSIRQNEKIILYAKGYIGSQYSFGNNSKLKMDCSGFTQQVYRNLGVLLPRSALKQSFYGVKIGLNELKAGDLLFYRTYKTAPSHVAIYAGNRKMIHASYLAKRVQFDSIDKSYYKERFLFAKRLQLDKNN